MSRVRSHPVRAKAVLGALAFILAAGLAACEEDSKTAPERCVEPPPYDIQAGAPADTNPCVTPVGHSISMTGPSAAGTAATTAGTSSGGSAGKGGSGGTATANAGAGGANGGAGGAP